MDNSWNRPDEVGSDRSGNLNLNNSHNQGLYTPEPPQLRENATCDNKQKYPCNNPQVSYMRTEEVRYMSFFRGGQRLWRADTFATERQMAKTGLFYLGERDKVKCFFCGGGLENWERYDDPWTEHAKWYPQCQFLLRCRGEEFVKNIQHGQQLQQQQHHQPLEQQQRLRQKEQERVQLHHQETQRQQDFERQKQKCFQEQRCEQTAARPQNSYTQQLQPSGQQQQHLFFMTTTDRGTNNRREDITRNNLPGGGPEIIDPQEEGRAIEEIVASAVEHSPLAARARVMGFTNNQIRQAMIREFREHNTNFTKLEELINSITNQELHRIEMFSTDDTLNRFSVLQSQNQQHQNESSSSASPNFTSLRDPISEINRLRYEQLCKICQQEDACVVFVPCGHLVACSACSTNTKRCPVSNCTCPNIEQRARAHTYEI